MIGLGHWLFVIICIAIAIWVIEIQFEERKQKMPYFLAIFAIFIGFTLYAIYDWRKYTIYQLNILESYVNLHYVSGQKELVAYTDIQNIKYVVEKGSRRCGLSFYIKNKPNIRTVSNIPCAQIHTLRGQLVEKTKPQ